MMQGRFQGEAVITKIALCVTIFAASAWAQSADTILVNGKILSADARFSTFAGVAVRDGKLVAFGTDTEIRKLAGGETRVIDLEGRTVIPGLIDSHMHAIRAALSFATEVNWIGAQSLKEALRRVTEASRVKQPGSWLIVAGGWNVDQFQGEEASHASRVDRGGPQQSRVCSTGLWLGDDDARRLPGAAPR